MARELYPLWLRAWHGLHALCFLVLVVSGLSVHYSDSVYTPVPFALAIRLHDVAGITLAALYVFFVVLNARSRNMLHYSLPRPVVRSVARQLGWYLFGMFRGDARPFPRSRAQKLNPAQAATYLVVMYALTPACTLSGIALLFPQLAPLQVSGAAGVWPMALLHLFVGWLLSLFLLLHLYMVTTGPTVGAYFKEITRGLRMEDLPDGTPDAEPAASERSGGANDHPDEPTRG